MTTDGNVTATPAVVDGLVYAPDFGGSLWAVDAVTGKVIWKNAISSYTGVPGDVSRTTPAYWQGALIMGEGAQTVNTQEGAIVFALDAKSGRPMWRTKVDADPVAIITSSPIVDSGVVYVGTSSKAESQDRPTTFRGSVLALSADTGKILWQTYLTEAGVHRSGGLGEHPDRRSRRGPCLCGDGQQLFRAGGRLRSPWTRQLHPIAGGQLCRQCRCP